VLSDRVGAWRIGWPIAQTNLALNGVQDRVEIIEQGGSEKVDKLRFTMNLDALNRIMTDDAGPNLTMISSRAARSRYRGEGARLE